MAREMGLYSEYEQLCNLKLTQQLIDESYLPSIESHHHLRYIVGAERQKCNGKCINILYKSAHSGCDFKPVNTNWLLHKHRP